MLFSHRYGYKSIREVLQFESMDEPLRNGLWNALISTGDPFEQHISMHMWVYFLKKRSDLWHPDTFRDLMSSTFENGNWYEVYDIMEYYSTIILETEPFIIECNRVLEKEMAAYRFVNSRITPIISEIEVSTIEQAIENKEDRWFPITQHLRTSLFMLSHRQQPDYRNSIKEAISAVEGACQIITGNSKATLGDTLKTLEQKGQLHKAMKEGFSKLYGYTSDAGGIRHALTEEAHTVTFSEAKFMMVTCSAFINYLQSNSTIVL